MQIDVVAIAQGLLDELAKKQVDDRLRAEGVVLLFERLREAVIKSEKAAAGVLEAVAEEVPSEKSE